MPRLQIQNLAIGVSRRAITASCASPRAVEGARQAHRERGGGLALQRQVGQHVAHQAAGRSAACRKPGAGPCGSARWTGPGASGRWCPARSPAASWCPSRGSAGCRGLRRPPARPAPGGTRLRSWRWPCCPACPSGAGCGSRCSEPSGSTRGRKKQVRPAGAWARIRKPSHMGAEKNHLWPVTRKRSSPAVLPVGHGLRRVGADVRAALLLRHAHAHGQAGLVAPGLERRVIAAAGEFGSPVGVDRRIAAQRGRDRVGHGDRAQHRGLELGEEHEGGGARNVGRLAPVRVQGVPCRPAPVAAVISA